MSPVTITVLAMAIGAAIVLAVVMTMLRDRRPAEDEAEGAGSMLPLFGQADVRMDAGPAGAGVLAGGVVRRVVREQTSPFPSPIVAGAAAAAPSPWAPVAPSTPTMPHGVPVIPEPAMPGYAAPAPAPVPVAPAPVLAMAPAPAPAPVVTMAPASAPSSAPAPQPAAPAMSATAPQPVAPAAPVPALHTTGIPGTMKEWRQLRFSVPADGAVEFLPGRLVIETGPDQGREIRLANIRGPNGVEITFGRGEGLPYRHIQLRDETVSRLHAGLRYAAGEWSLRNYSVTNPVVYNQTILTGDDEPLLEEGDRIEMGAVTFSFKSR